jgi:uncharacterized membrane protein YphA (DoxX/SURF4 family)
MFVAVSILLALLCLLPAAAKLSGQAQMRQSAQHLGIPWERFLLIGLAELAAAAGVLAGLRVRPLGVAAAVGMVLLLAGALIVHSRAGDAAKEQIPAGVALLVSIAYLVVAATA